MAFGRFERPDDMQEDTYRIVAGWIIQAQNSYNRADPKGFEKCLSCLMHLALPQIKVKERATFRERRDAIRDALYGVTPLEPKALSKVFDQAEDLFIDVLDVLNRAGILFKMRADLNSIAAD
jgi:hypothetical protein